MRSDKSAQREDKWDSINRKYVYDASREATCFLTCQHTLKLLKEMGITEGKVLDIGCGFGEIDILLVKQSNFQILGSEISKYSIENAKENIKKAGLESKIKIEYPDVYQMPYPDRFFDVVLSFGYVSAATYPKATGEVARVLKPGGVLICDFINCLCLYKIPSTLKRVILKKEAPYYRTLKGIKEHFAQSGLQFKKQVLFNTYPPFRFKKGPRAFLAFEKSVGWLLRGLLGRVRIVAFEKVK